MQTKQILKGGFAVAATMSVLAACGPAPVQPSPSPTATATPVATPTPDVSPTATPTPDVSPTATATPAATPTPSATATATATPDPSATPTTPLASATSDISVVEKTTFNGKIFDDTQAPLDGVTVTAKSLNSSVPYEATSTTAGGSYAFNNAPSGVQLEITVSKPGYTTRRRVEVLKSNKEGDPNANKYDFGAGSGSLGTAANALSDKPEVTVVTPGRNSAGVSPTTSFVLRFSEGMDRATVVDNFEVRAFTSEKLSVDTTGAVATLVGSGDVNTIGGTRVWDKSAFNVSWNSDDTEATFTFKEERSLPTDKDTDKVPDYQVSLERQDSSIKDKSGISRSTSSAVPGNGGTGAFKLTEGNFERSYKFSISADTTRPRLDSITAQTAENSGANSDGDAIKVRYSERMIHYTLGPTIAGGMGGVSSQGAASNNAASAEATAANYKVTVIRAANTLMNQITWAALGGRAIFDTNDPTHKTVLLLPPTADVSTAARTTAAAGGVTELQPITGTITYTDGTTEPINIAADTAGNRDQYTELAADLNTGFAFTAGTLVVTPVNDPAGAAPDDAIEAGDTYRITLTSPATKGGKSVSFVSIAQSGAFATTSLNAPAGGFRIFPGAVAGDRPDLYDPGDNVIVQVDTTVLDPAGNSVDSSGDDASANAS